MHVGSIQQGAVQLKDSTGVIINPATKIDPKWILGGVEFDLAASGVTPKSLIGHIVETRTGSGSIQRWATFDDQGGTAYQVPTGKKFFGAYIIISGDTATVTVGLGYGDTSVDDADTTNESAPTNAVDLIGESQESVMNSPLTNDNADKGDKYDIFLHIPASKYPYMTTQHGESIDTWCVLFGVELDA